MVSLRLLRHYQRAATETWDTLSPCPFGVLIALLSAVYCSISYSGAFDSGSLFGDGLKRANQARLMGGNIPGSPPDGVSEVRGTMWYGWLVSRFVGWASVCLSIEQGLAQALEQTRNEIQHDTATSRASGIQAQGEATTCIVLSGKGIPAVMVNKWCRRMGINLLWDGRPLAEMVQGPFEC